MLNWGAEATRFTKGKEQKRLNLKLRRAASPLLYYIILYYYIKLYYIINY